MKPHVDFLESMPQPDTLSPAIVMIASGALAICYGTGDEEFAVAAFRSCSALKLGGPNDETLNGHPLYRYGLKNYSIHRIRSSPWIAELEQQNSVHPLHDATRFLEGKVHYLFALKEETVECIVEQGPGQVPAVTVFKSRGEALAHCRNTIEA